jgi:ribonucleoside-triphosphate reductase
MKLVKKIATNYKLPYYTISPTYSVCEEHGYLAGEVWKCPKCGRPTEVYSRITGYYRPVKNWNDGKAQEFKDRKTYDINDHEDPNCDHKTCYCGNEKKEAPTVKELMLFTSPTCPNCKMAKMMLDKEGVSYHNIEISADANKQTAIAYGITKAPTLLVPNGQSYDIYDNASLIRGYLNKVKSHNE